MGITHKRHISPGWCFLLSGCYKKKRLQHKDRNGESLKRALLPNPQVLQCVQVYRSQTHKSNRTAKPPCVTSWLLVLNCIYYRWKQSAPWLRIGLRPIYWAGLLPLFPCALPRPIQQYHVSGKSFPLSFPFRAWTALDKNEYYRQFSLCFSLFWTALYNILHTAHNSNPSPAAILVRKLW